MTFHRARSQVSLNVPLFSTDASAPRPRAANESRPLRLLSFNIQAGIHTSGYHHYLTRSWKHVLPYPQRLENLDRIANLVRDYDFVGIQESDGGSLRSGFINQTEYLALRGRFPYWYDQTNRNLGHFARHSLGLLSRFLPSDITEVRLPGMIPGRGVLCVRFGHGDDALLLMILHLALGRRARQRQLGAISDVVNEHQHVIVMGDFNCCSESDEINWLLARTRLSEPVHGLHTFPSWRPRRNIDHILVSSSIDVRNVKVLNHMISDHLPVAMEVTLPADVALAPAPVVESDYVAPLAAAAGL